jgi:predicted transposase/invertase (TIGR01784 family)
MLSKFLDPKNDVAFKKIFGTEKNKDILIHFLNDMLNFNERPPIREVTFLKTVQDPETAAKKASLVDILCKDEKGHTYIVEMQVAKEKGFEKRAQYYASKAYISQANSGTKYHDLKEIIFLAICDFIMFGSKDEYKSDHVILDKKTHENDLKDFSFTFLELPKFNKDIHHLSNMIDKWSYFFKYAEKTS